MRKKKKAQTSNIINIHIIPPDCKGLKKITLRLIKTNLNLFEELSCLKGSLDPLAELEVVDAEGEVIELQVRTTVSEDAREFWSIMGTKEDLKLILAVTVALASEKVMLNSTSAREKMLARKHMMWS